MSTNIVLKDNTTLLEHSIGFIISPFQIAINSSVDYIKGKWNSYFFSKNIYSKYIQNKREIFKLKKETYLLKAQITNLKKKIKTFSIHSDQFRVIGRTKLISIDRNFIYNSILINSGTLENIKKNMVVVNENLELVGNIIEPITPLTAKVRLITSEIGGVGAYIEDEELEGFLEGNNNKICSFKYLIANKAVKIGSNVLTSGTGGIFPEKLLIGKVIEIKKGYLMQKISVKPFFLERPINNLFILERVK